MPTNKMDKAKLIRTIEYVSNLLAEKRYSDVEELTKGIRLPANDIHRAIEEYGCTLVSFPINACSEIDVMEVSGSNPQMWGVDVPIYTKEEGRSDLTLQMTLIESGGKLFNVEIDDMHVL